MFCYFAINHFYYVMLHPSSQTLLPTSQQPRAPQSVWDVELGGSIYVADKIVQNY